MLDRIARFSFDNRGNITTAQRIADFLESQRLKMRRVRRFDTKGKGHLEVQYGFHRQARG